MAKHAELEGFSESFQANVANQIKLGREDPVGTKANSKCSC